MMGQWTTQIFALTTQQQHCVETGIHATDHAKISRFFSLLELESLQQKQPIMLTILPILPATTLSNLYPPVLEE